MCHKAVHETTNKVLLEVNFSNCLLVTILFSINVKKCNHQDIKKLIIKTLYNWYVAFLLL